MEKSYFKITALTVFIFLISHIGLSQVKPSENFDELLEKGVVELMEDGDIPGLSLIIVNGNQQIIKTYGVKGFDTEEVITPHTLFELGSCSKAFTGLALSKLVVDHKLSLNSNISEYIPWLKLKFNGNPAEVTLEQLLHHTSGIPWSTISKIPETNADDALEQTVRSLIGLDLKTEPGTEYEYATINYDVLALIIQQVANMTFESYLNDHILIPAQLNNTSIGYPIDKGRMATGHKVSFFNALEYEAPKFKGNNAAGYVISDANDVAVWLKMQIGLIESDFYELIESTHQRDETVGLHGTSSYAIGWEVSLDGSGEIYHGGLNPNFTSYMTFRKKEKIGVAVLSNSNSTYTKFIGNKVMKSLAGEVIDREFKPGDRNDKTYSMIFGAVILYTLIVIILIIRVIYLSIIGERKFENLTIRKLVVYVISLIAVIPFLAGLYIIPMALADFSWKAMLVWTPTSLVALVFALVVAIAITYVSYFLSICFPETNEYKRRAPQIILMSILSGISNVVVIIMVTSAIGSQTELKYLIFYYTLTLVVYLLGRRFVQISLIKFTRGLIYDLRIQLIDKIFSTSYQKFEKIDRGRVYTALNDDINTIGTSTNLIVTLTTSAITTLGAFIYLSSIALWATFITIALIIAISSIYYFASVSTNIYFEKARDSRDVFMRLINGMIDGFKEISLHRNKKLEYKEDVADSAREYKEKISTADIRFTNAFLVGESLLVVLLGLISLGMKEVFPNVELYTVMSFVIVLLYLIGPLSSILSSVPSIMRLKIAWNRINQFIAEIPSNLNLNDRPKATASRVSSFVAKNIKFEYSNGIDSGNFSVGPINLNIAEGEIIFIIGGNGSGKTTFAKLITGLYEPTEGKFLINDKLVYGHQLSEYFSVVFSPSFLFEKLYNIDLNEKGEALDEFLKILDLSEKVKVSDNRYNTIALSSGQRKRLALLQCYLEDSPIYLFDEWAADQDPDYRNFFYRTLLPEMKKLGKIIIAITHDDNYFDVADKVLKMKHGKIEYSKENLNPYLGMQKEESQL